MRKISGLLAAVTVSLSFASTVTLAEELDNYVYNSDGTYYKVGEGNDNAPGGGFVQLEGQYGWDSTSTGIGWGLRGAYGTKIRNKYHGQIDVDTNSTGLFNVAAHVSTDVREDFVVGGFLRYSDTGFYLAGAESAIYKDRLTFWARAGYGGESGGASGIFLGSIGSRLYLKDNFRVDVHADYVTTSAANANLWSAGATANYRFTRMNQTTVFAGYQSTFGVNIIKAGVRYSFGSDSLKDEERNNVRWK